MAVWDDITKREQRAQAMSLMLPWKELAEVYARHAEVSLCVIEDASDEFLIGIMGELRYSRQEMIGEIPELKALSPEDQEKLLDLFGVEQWTVENVRRGAREEAPLPLGIAVGGVMVDTSYGEEWPSVWAVATSATDPEAMAKTFLRMCRKTFGKMSGATVLLRSNASLTRSRSSTGRLPSCSTATSKAWFLLTPTVRRSTRSQTSAELSNGVSWS